MGGDSMIQRRKSYGYTKFPKMWREQLRKVKARGTTYAVALVILEKAGWSEWVTLPNVGLATLGISRRVKYGAIRQLQQANVILVEERGHRSPRIKPLFRE